ncbi:LysR family transcriptional regulator [Bacteriovorax sp. DB6_IX]|uniref:LysR family transcriptional regulator n=1 Tax=Bacteriovorax sp. DB6_IX TaxID=1353530 RepID=UPI00038A2674|nr:LysR family transcriptional regulator [Bacteriovorax sp. DB6_IX]EQC52346.1 LysR substrate-binding domain protein [Bacteriovorax sp. DB6_IX]
MNLDQLQLLKIIDEEGSFSKASEKLNKAKSAISYTVSNLEDELGLLLIDRSKYRPVLTNYGKQLLEKSLPVLQAFEDLEHFAKTLSSNQELKIRLSMSALWPVNKIAPVLRDLEEKYNQTEIVFTTEVLSGERLLFEGQVDMAILTNLENRVDIDYKEIGTLKMPMVISANHPLAKECSKKKIGKKQLESYPQIIVRSTLPTEGKSFGVLKEAKKWYVSDLETKLRLILEGLGWGRLPDHMVDELIQREVLKEITPQEDRDNTISVYLARKKTDWHGLVSHYIWDHI